jgi:ketohexokinase
MLFALLCHDKDGDVESKVRFAVQLATCKVQKEGFGGVGGDVMEGTGKLRYENRKYVEVAAISNYVTGNHR